MPKIPTFTSQARPTAEVGAVKSNIQIPLSQNIGTALAPVTDAIVDYKVKERKLEADNKAYSLLSDMYIDQKDASGNIIQKGLFTIQSETKNNGEPSSAAEYNNIETNKLFNYFKENKFNGVDNYTKKIIASKFFSTAGILKTKSLEGSRNQQIKDSVNIDEDYIGKEALVLKDVGPVYLPIYKDKVKEKINANSNYDEGQKKILIEQYNKFGATNLATSMATNQPNSFKNSFKKGFFNDVPMSELLKLDLEADKQIKQQKFNILLSPLDIPFDANPQDFVTANKEIKNKTFGGNKNFQSLYNTLNPQEKIEFEKEYQTKAKGMRSDRQLQILTSNNIAKFETAQNTNKVLEEKAIRDGTYTETLKKLFPNNQRAVEQLVGFNLKLADGTANKVSKFDSNEDIIKLIINDNVNTVYDKFTLIGETESKSIAERVGTELNVVDLKYLNNLLNISGDKDFKQNHTKFFKFIDMFGLEVAGSSALKNLDPERDKRLNNFKYTMYGRYINGLKQGLTSDQLLKATKGNKKFIGYDFHTFIPNMSDVFKSIDSVIQTIPSTKSKEEILSIKQKKEKELGRKLTAQEFLELTGSK
tara:strand:+ start:78 stop:1844 length:1767 start_codon:yes stop_codon:yes gene_type:complete